jgi:hypothetical protein
VSAHLIGIIGIPGDGKSHFARSATLLGPTAVALTDPKEASFYRAPSGVDFNPKQLVTLDEFYDLDWRPHLGAPKGLQAGGYTRLMRWLDQQAEAKVPYVVLDTGTEASRLAQHACLKVAGVFSPGDIEYGRGYSGTDTLVLALWNECKRLHARGTTVIVTFHAGMKEGEGAGDAVKRTSMGKDPVTKEAIREWTFDDQLLAVGEGRNKTVQNWSASFDLWLYTKPTGFGPGRKFFVTAVPDAVRPAKASVTWKEGAQPQRLPNTVGAVLDAIA